MTTLALVPAGLGSLEGVGPAPLDENPAAVYLARLARGSRRTQHSALEEIARLLSGGRQTALELEWHALRYQHTAALRAALAEKYSPATANRMLAALRGVLREAWKLGLMTAEQRARASEVECVKGTGLPAGRALSPGELGALFAACNDRKRPALGDRDGALLALLYATGLRRFEVTGLDHDDIDLEGKSVHVRAGKGRKDRIAYLGSSLERLERWLAHRGATPGALFTAVTKNGRVTDHRLEPQSVLDILTARSREAGIKRCSPHDLRRTHITHLLDAGVDVGTVQSLAGHRNVATTLRYDRRGEQPKRNAAELLHVPRV